MNSQGSVTIWFNQLQEGDHGAAQNLWERYFEKMVHKAREKLRHVPRRAADEEDVALGAFDSFCRGAAQGRFPDLQDRDQLWGLLLVITQRKAGKLIQHEGQQKRDWRRTQNEGKLPPDDSNAMDQLLLLEGEEPNPEFAAQVAEACQRLFDMLDNSELQSIAQRKLEGYTNEEIAQQLNCALPTVERRLRMIRKRWEREFDEETGFGRQCS